MFKQCCLGPVLAVRPILTQCRGYGDDSVLSLVFEMRTLKSSVQSVSIEQWWGSPGLKVQLRVQTKQFMFKCEPCDCSSSEGREEGTIKSCKLHPQRWISGDGFIAQYPLSFTMCEQAEVRRRGGNPGPSTVIESSAPNVIHFNRSQAAGSVRTWMT